MIDDSQNTNNDLINTLKDVASFIKKEFGAEKVILFGSYAYGNPTKDSDIDILVVMETKERFPVEGAKIKIAIRKKFNLLKPMDILVRSKDSLQKRIDIGDFFIKTILEKGVFL